MTGDQLKSFRLSLQMTQVEFGKELGLTHPQVQVSQLERGERPITLRLLKSIERWHCNIKLMRKLYGGAN